MIGRSIIRACVELSSSSLRLAGWAGALYMASGGAGMDGQESGTVMVVAKHVSYKEAYDEL
jgi:hypothetical protein